MANTEPRVFGPSKSAERRALHHWIKTMGNGDHPIERSFLLATTLGDDHFIDKPPSAYQLYAQESSEEAAFVAADWLNSNLKSEQPVDWFKAWSPRPLPAGWKDDVWKLLEWVQGFEAKSGRTGGKKAVWIQPPLEDKLYLSFDWRS